MKSSALERKRKSEQVYRTFQAMTARRMKLAADFRARLIAEIKDKNPGASRGALIDLAVSSYVQASELSDRFLSGRATPSQVSQLSIARGQLQRALRSLGVIDRDDDDAPEDAARELRKIAAEATRESETVDV